jgi:phage tail sheath protein FI
MALLSPGVEVNEKDFSTIVPQVASAFGGIVGRFKTGPINEPILISSVSDLVGTFGKPDDDNFTEWFTAAEFLKYSNKVWVVRAEPSAVLNASASGSSNISIKSQTHYEEILATAGNSGTLDSVADGLGEFVARQSGAGGNSLRVIMVDAGTWPAFKVWADNSAANFPGSVSLSKYFSQPPRTSAFVEARSESGSGAVLSAALANGAINTVTVVNGGRDYGTAYIEVGGAYNQFVNLTPVISNGVVASAILSTGGSGYPVGTHSIPITGTGGSLGTVSVEVVGGVITTATLTAGGSGYPTVPYEMDVGAITAQGSGAKLYITAFNGVISAVTVTNGGSGYGTTAPALAVYDSGKDDELHVLVIDEDGSVSGTRNYVLEKWEGLSKAVNAKDSRGNDNYYRTILGSESSYLYFANPLKNPGAGDPVLETASGTKLVWGSTVEAVYAKGKKFLNTISAASLGEGNFYNKKLAGGSDGTLAGISSVKAGYDLLANTELYDVNLFMTGTYSVDIVKHIIENVVVKRKDAMGFVSPHNAGKPYTKMNDIMNFKMIELNLADQYAQYAVMDTGFKYIYDGFNSKYRWVPLNGDIAGLCARVDETDDPWFSPGGYNRGGVKNVVKLAYNPSNAERDVLYPKGINPVVSIPGSGVVLFGDRTMTSKPSAFDRINVRRLFNILEKSISIAAKYQLFEFNDTFTRSQFRNMVEPFLRDIQGRRGVTDFSVICDDTNNTGEIIDRNEFVADIYVKPARSINFIYLNFIATKTGVDFSTVIGG